MGRILPFGIGGYRSFGDELQLFPRISKVNVIAGGNNSGKSNVIRFLQEHHGRVYGALERPNVKWQFEPLDRHLGSESGAFQFAVGIPLDSDQYQEIEENERLRRHFGGAGARAVVAKLLGSDYFTMGTDVAWFRYRTRAQGREFNRVDDDELVELLTEREWRGMGTALTNLASGALRHWVDGVMRVLAPTDAELPTVTVVPAIRQVGEAGTEPDDHSGIGLIERLALLQNPPIENRDLKEDFERINDFLQWVLDDDSATLEVPYGRDTILVHHDGRTLPLSSLGTGVHEVIILAAAATVVKEQVLCIEEPELHLHPLLQRKLLKYLSEETTNQYFITTHSAQLLNEQVATIYHLKHKDGRTVVNLAVSDQDQFEICRDLGYRASDLIQTNFVIWVEGPSDRIYVRHWISVFDSELVEGIHYSIMFYGGRLLNHVSADDQAVSDFISLRKLNRNVAVIMDSDRKHKEHEINETKRRVVRETTEGGGFSWVTAGREIENYIPCDLMTRVLRQLYGQDVQPSQYNRWHNALTVRSEGAAPRCIDKIKVARTVASFPADFSQLDLEEQMARLGNFIYEANGLG